MLKFCLNLQVIVKPRSYRKEDGLTLVEILKKIYKLKSSSSNICVLAGTTKLSKLEIWKTEVLIEDIEKVTSPKQHLWKYLIQYFQVLGQGRKLEVVTKVFYPKRLHSQGVLWRHANYSKCRIIQEQKKEDIHLKKKLEKCI